MVDPSIDVEEFRRLGHRAVELAAEHLASLRARPVFKPMAPGERAQVMNQQLPEQGAAPDQILDLVRDQILAHPMGNGHPRFFGWVNSPPAPMGILAELLAAALNPSVAGGDHAAVYLERCAVRWMMELVGFPVEGSMGLLASGGSAANLTCLAAARHWAASTCGFDVRLEGLQSARPQRVLYVSEEGHNCLHKAAELLGLGRSAVRVVPVDPRFRMDLDALRDMVAADRKAGRHPFCVAASAGTVNTGAIDPLDALADFCAAERLWLHVDGSYGAVGRLNPALAERFAGLARADSLALDPHKWLSVPIECGCALVRDGELLRDAFSLVPPYLRTELDKGFGGLPWFSEYGLQQTRGFRALKLWMTLLHMGRSGAASLIARHCSLAAHLASLVEAATDLELLAPVELSVVCFRCVPRRLRGDEARLNALNKALMERVQAEGEAFVSGTTLRGRFALRACVLHHATTEDDLEALVDAVREVGGSLEP